MLNDKPIRIPQQTRSLATKTKLLAAARQLFAETGYYKTTANAIARKAKTSVGSFYAYFSDKESIFIELMHGIYAQLHTALELCLEPLRQPDLNPRTWVLRLTRSYSDAYLSESEITAELYVLYYSRLPRVTALADQEHLRAEQAIESCLFLLAGRLPLHDIHTAAMVIQNILVYTPGRVLFDRSGLGKEAVLSHSADLIWRYLAG